MDVIVFLDLQELGQRPTIQLLGDSAEAARVNGIVQFLFEPFLVQDDKRSIQFFPFLDKLQHGLDLRKVLFELLQLAIGIHVVLSLSAELVFFLFPGTKNQMRIGILGRRDGPEPSQQGALELAPFGYPVLVNVVDDVTDRNDTGLGTDWIHEVKLGQLFEDEGFRLVERNNSIKGGGLLHAVQHDLQHGYGEERSLGCCFGHLFCCRPVLGSSGCAAGGILFRCLFGILRCWCCDSCSSFLFLRYYRSATEPAVVCQPCFVFGINNILQGFS
mmetsp:Transcript_13521/g.33980  ORF Transcript_13521/g.33980 Transcript_13521/m.33980 type:complete len:273 (-) Transcript_13521:616-1434(-)